MKWLKKFKEFCVAKEAVILLNMGGPNNLHEVEMFLKNMFNDKNILTMKSDWLRKFVAGSITFFRAEESQEIYKKLGGKSPLVELTTKVVDALQEVLGDDIIVDFAMRYTPPFASEVLKKVQEVEKIYLLPMYPQYSTTTTKSSLEDFEEAFHLSKSSAILSEVKHYYENDTLNEAIIERIAQTMQESDYNDFDLIFSAHGLPQKIVDAGDPYERQIEHHVKILSRKLQERGLNFHQVHLAYQSKVGPMAWLEPSLEQKLQSVRNRGVIIYPIAFTIDNSETIFELDIEYREIAEQMGFKEYRVCTCLNDHPLFIKALAEVLKKMRA